MSFHIIVLDNVSRNIYAIADKRTMHQRKFLGKVLSLEHLHDNAVKIYQINNRVFCAAGTVCYLADRFKLEIMAESHLSTQQILEVGKKINRIIMPPPIHDYPMTTATLFGMMEDGRMFHWLGERDGSEFFNIIEPGKLHITALGGFPGTQEAVGQYLMNLRVKQLPIDDILLRCMKYAAEIDSKKTISTTYDIIHQSF